MRYSINFGTMSVKKFASKKIINTLVKMINLMKQLKCKNLEQLLQLLMSQGQCLEVDGIMQPEEQNN